MNTRRLAALAVIPFIAAGCATATVHAQAAPLANQATPAVSATPVPPAYPVELNLTAIPVVDGAKAQTRLEGGVTIKLREGGWAAVVLRSPTGQPVAGHIIFASTADDDWINQHNPCGNIPLDDRSPAWGGTSRKTAAGEGWFCEVTGPQTLRLYMVVTRGPSSTVPGFGAVATDRLLFGVDDLLNNGRGWMLYGGPGIPDMPLSGGMWVSGSNAVLTATDGLVDGPSRGQ
jgi:hypothetical protein